MGDQIFDNQKNADSSHIEERNSTTMKLHNIFVDEEHGIEQMGETWSSEEEKRALRKLDWNLIPLWVLSKAFPICPIRLVQCF